MALAVSRGEKFEKVKISGLMQYVADTPKGRTGFFAALEDVARALRYENGPCYNDACVNDPREVRRRIRAL